MERDLVKIVLLFFSGWFLNFLLKYVLKKSGKRSSSTIVGGVSSFISTLQKPLSFFIWGAVLIIIAELALKDILGGDCPINFTILYHMLFAFTLGWILLIWKGRWLNQLRNTDEEKKSTVPAIHLDLLSKFATVVIIVITFLMFLDATGINIQTLIAFGGVGGIAIAFAAQQVISNLFSGMMIYITQPFGIGEWVSLPEHNIEGYIEVIGWYNTQIRGLDKKPIYIPNSLFSQTYVVTNSRMTHLRIKEVLKLRHEDLQKLPSILNNIQNFLDSYKRIDHHQKKMVYFLAISTIGLEIEYQINIPFKLYNQHEEIEQEILLGISSIIINQGAEFAKQIGEIKAT